MKKNKKKLKKIRHHERVCLAQNRLAEARLRVLVDASLKSTDQELEVMAVRSLPTKILKIISGNPTSFSLNGQTIISAITDELVDRQLEISKV